MNINVNRLKELLTVFDFPSGVILTLHTLTMIALSWISVMWHKDISTVVVTIFGMNLGAFATHKTVTAVMNNSATQTTTNEEQGVAKP